MILFRMQNYVYIGDRFRNYFKLIYKSLIFIEHIYKPMINNRLILCRTFGQIGQRLSFTL